MKHDLCVFVVDDMPAIAYTLSAVLRDHGFSVIPYTDPERALRDAQAFTPDVLISDIEMPKLGGVELAMQVQDACPCCTILLMSGQPGVIRSLELARNKGFRFPVLEKPVSATSLTAQLEGIIRIGNETRLAALQEHA